MLQRKVMFSREKFSCCWLKIDPRDQHLWNYFDGQLNDLIHEDWQETGTGIGPKTCVNTEEENLMIKVKESGDELPEQRIISHLSWIIFFPVLILNFSFTLRPKTNQGVVLCEAERNVDRTQASPTVSRFNNCHSLWHCAAQRPPSSSCGAKVDDKLRGCEDSSTSCFLPFQTNLEERIFIPTSYFHMKVQNMSSRLYIIYNYNTMLYECIRGRHKGPQ